MRRLRITVRLSKGEQYWTYQSNFKGGKIWGQLKAKLTRFINHLAIIDKNVEFNRTELRCRREKNEDVWQEFEQVQSAIELLLNDEENEETTNYRVEFEDAYFNAISLCDDLMYDRSNEQIENQGNGDVRRNSNMLVPVPQVTASSGGGFCCNNANAPIQLAAISLPTFSGIYSEWPTYYDIFGVMVHKNDRISDIQRFFHLRASLSGEAAQVIQGIETTAANYSIAWESLIARYNNKKVLIQSHTRGLYELSVITEESKQLRKLIDKLNCHINALESLGENPRGWGSMLIHLITGKLDISTIKAWETIAPKDEIPPIQVLIQFLEKRFKIVEAVESVSQMNIKESSDSKGNKKVNKGYPKEKTYYSFAATDMTKCYNCNLPHTIYKCPAFLALSVPDRINKVNALRLCKICIRPHNDKKCLGKKCFKCHKAHNTMLHLNASKDGEENRSNTMTAAGNDNSNTGRSDNETIQITAHGTVAATAAAPDKHVMLSTAVIKVYDKMGNAIHCRALLDSGSQNNFVTEYMAQTLQLGRNKIKSDVSGIGQSIHTITSAVTVKIRSRTSDYEKTISCLILPRLTNDIPSQVIDPKRINVPDNIVLADNAYNKPQKIDMLLGNELFFDLMRPGQIKTTSAGPTIQETRLGWIIAGPIPKCKNNTDRENITLLSEIVINNLEDQISKFWRLETVSNNKNNYTMEEKACQAYFNQTVRQGVDGKFIVKLPFKIEIKELGNSYPAALRRFFFLEKRLKFNPVLKLEYIKFMEEYIELNHMDVVLENEEKKIGVNDYFLPHHAVINTNSTTTRLRVVFDASCKTDIGLSLNDALLKGPTIQEELITILARFRKHKFAFSADVSKMYRQIWVDPQQRNYQKIIWRANPEDPLRTYRLNTVTYGTVPASFLATGCLAKLAEKEYHMFPDACDVIKSDFYMDDYLGGADTKNNALRLGNSLIEVMIRGGFPLRKWMSNSSELLADMPNIGNKSMTIMELENKMTKILGLLWCPERDVFKYKIEITALNDLPVTKRNILSQIASLFDPLGLVGPIVIRAKILMQKLWQLQCDWDKPVPIVIQKEWKSYVSSLNYLRELEIPRYLGTETDYEVQIHGFADASLLAYGACLYIRCSSNKNVHVTKLICAKSKIAPLKIISLPRLELCAAVILARLANKVLPKLKLNIKNKYFWTDSSITLAWITSPSSKWKTFVAHRVSEIQDMTRLNEWNHVSTQDNPADLISRGCGADQIINNDLWWEGPHWLTDNSENWPKSKINVNAGIIPEAKEKITLLIEPVNENLIKNYSSWNKLLRVFAYCLRFIKVRVKKLEVIGPIQLEELRAAEIAVIKITQSYYWSKNGIMRVGGRLKNALYLDQFQRSPILIPQNSAIANLILQNEHEKLMHAGPQAMLANTRLKLRPIIVEPIMGNLPAERLEPCRAFKKCGVDFAGPITIKTSLRKRQHTRAVHIELVGDLTSDAFLNALKRFIGRRGVCSDIYSDNATNFVGANKKLLELKCLFQSTTHLDKMYNALATEGINWHFIPPPPDLLILIEAVLNSRPLTPLSSDPMDATPLTPAHFLIGEPTCSVPEPDLSAVLDNRLKRWQRVTRLTQCLWKRWNDEYLSQLQTRKKWLSNKGPNLSVGTLVLIKEDNITPLSWSLGRVIRVQAGADGVVRVATVLSRGKEVKRSVRKLCPLPFE
ncbi:Uncharacterized protein FWK35_00016915, partial [Aphis craccivora]